jgi:23S rRNA pseudouridine1911/1915/1917 synthase
MAIRHGHATSKHAQTFYEVQERFAGFSLVKALPKTGRTHQIRLHLAHLRCPVLCDKLYSGRSRITRGELTKNPADQELLLDRQALHARRLKFSHPRTGESLELIAPLPQDLEAVLAVLRGNVGAY